jgi:adenosine deaminase
LRDHIRSIVERSHRIAASWEMLGNFPFQDLATWTAADIDWLMQTLNPSTDAPWVNSLPKIELHCHLGGFATHGKLLAQVSAAAQGSLAQLVEQPLPDSWPLPENNITLDAYMKLGDANGSALLKDPGCLKKQCETLYQHLLEQNVCYAEIRCSPANYTSHGRSSWHVLSEIKSHFDQCMAAHPVCRTNFLSTRCHINLIVIATRREKGDYRAAISRHLALAVTAAEHWANEQQCRVVGVDLAGYEDPTTRAHYFREEFSAIHRCGLALTAHAGEIDDAEAIWSAVFDLNARRLGHALHLIDSPELLRSVAARNDGHVGVFNDIVD